MIRFWEEGLLFCDGWYIYTNGKGDYSSAHEYCKKYGEQYNLHFVDINKMQKG